MNIRANKYIQDYRTFPQDAALAFRLHGVQGWWDALRQRTLDRIVATGHVVIFAQTLDSAFDVPAPAGVDIRPLSQEDWPALSSIVSQRDLDRFRVLMSSGCHGVVAWRGSQPIGYGWVAERLGPEVTACPLLLPEHAAYLWDLYVVPGERSTGVGSALASARIRIARERGFSEGWRMISPANVPSLRTLAKSATHTRKVGELRYIKILSRVYSRFTPAAIHGKAA